MDMLFIVTRGITFGIMIGFIISGIRWKFHEKGYSEKQIQKGVQFRNIISKISIYITSFTLLIGLVWTIYFMILGVVDRSQTEYATNVSQLIVSVITIISIIFAFIQFLKDK